MRSALRNRRRWASVAVLWVLAWTEGAAATEPPTPPPDAAPAQGDRAPPPPNAEGWGETDRIRIAVMDLRGSEGIPPALVASLTALIPDQLDSLGPFKAITSQDIMQMLAIETLKQSMGCDDVLCIAEIGGALGADYAITGSVTLVATTYLLQLQLMNIQYSRIDARAVREYQGSISGLLEEVRAATKLVVRDLLAERSGLLALSVAEEGATVKVDNSIVGVAPLADLTLAGGLHTIAVEKEGFIRFTKDVQVVANQTTRLTVALAPSQEYLRAYQQSASRSRIIAWSVTGGGAALLGTAVALLGVGAGKAGALRQRVADYEAQTVRDTATHQELDAAERELATLDVMFLTCGITGLLAAGVGVFLIVTGDDPSRYELQSTATAAPAAGVELYASPTLGGLVAGARF